MLRPFGIFALATLSFLAAQGTGIRLFFHLFYVLLGIPVVVACTALTFAIFTPDHLKPTGALSVLLLVIVPLARTRAVNRLLREQGTRPDAVPCPDPDLREKVVAGVTAGILWDASITGIPPPAPAPPQAAGPGRNCRAAAPQPAASWRTTAPRP